MSWYFRKSPGPLLPTNYLATLRGSACPNAWHYLGLRIDGILRPGSGPCSDAFRYLIMPEQISDTVRTLARDLRSEEPRPPQEPLGGFAKGARALDKCRASLVGWNGEFKFNCPMDQQFFSKSGIDAEEFEAQVATGATDQEMDQWVQENANPVGA